MTSDLLEIAAKVVDLVRGRPDAIRLARQALTVAERIDVRGRDQCWPWTGMPHAGAGRCQLGGRESARRAAWMLAHGPIPARHWVRATCGQSLCCNPAHLFLQALRVPRPVTGRTRSGRRLTVPDVVAIRRAVSAGTPQRRLAEKYAVSPAMISLIVHRYAYACVP